MSLPAPSDPDFYAPDHRLTAAYDEATLLDEEGLEALCPSYIELSEVETRYLDDTPLGQGAIKDVYQTYDKRTKRWVAMARLRKDRGPEFYDLFVHEAWLTSALSHPNIIKIYDAGVDSDRRPFFTMDLKGNTTLHHLVKAPTPTSLRELLEIFSKVCDAVAYAHSRGIIHLDLKPDNIQTDAFGEVLVCDWGLGKVIGEAEDGENDIPATFRPLDNMTLLGQIKGSPGFMAPEQVIPKSTKDYRTDVFALGCVLHLILTGEAPFTGTPERILDATTRANVIPLRHRFPKLAIPESLEAVVIKATARNPDDRYPSALALQQEIDQFLSGYSTQAEQPGFFREARLFLTRNRTPAAITLLAFLALTVLTVLFIRRLDRQSLATEQVQLQSDQFESEASSLQSDYQSLIDQSEQSKEQLAAKLAKSANSLKNLGIFERPLQTVREARELASLAHSLDPHCAEARSELFSLNCVTLNLRDALAMPSSPDYRWADYLQFAKAFPQFTFTEEIRPSSTQLTEFFQTARQINPNHAPLMARILSYDSATRKNKKPSAPVIISLLEYVNGGEEHLICTYKQKDASFFLWSDRDVRLFIPYGSGSCLLEPLRLRSLKLDISGKFDLSDLKNLPIQSLDLRDCEQLSISQPVQLERLRKILIRPGQLDPATLRRLIQTREPLEIIETP